MARGLPVYSVADVDDIYGRVVAYERLLLPFQTDGKVCHIISTAKLNEVDEAATPLRIA